MIRVYIDFENEEKYPDRFKMLEDFKRKYYKFISMLKTDNGSSHYIECDSLSEFRSILGDIYSLFDNYDVVPNGRNIFITIY